MLGFTLGKSTLGVTTLVKITLGVTMLGKSTLGVTAKTSFARKKNREVPQPNLQMIFL